MELYLTQTFDHVPSYSALQWTAITIVLAWLNLLLYMRMLPWLGKYIILFQDVIATFFGCFMVGGVLVTAFTLSFYMILSNHEDFQTPEHSLFKIMTMLAGEFNYQEFFYKPLPPEGFGSDWDQWYESPPFPMITYILFCVFFFAGPMITMNVFVGLIVDT